MRGCVRRVDSDCSDDGRGRGPPFATRSCTDVSHTQDELPAMLAINERTFAPLTRAVLAGSQEP